jgi:hypothetical protein
MHDLSFAVTTGVWYRCLDVDLVKPEDYHLTFSFELGKTLRQPWFSYKGSAKRWDRPDVWYLLPDGSNLVESVRDAAAVLVASGLPLLDRFAVPELASRALLTQTSRNPDFGVSGMAMPGAPDSPRWRDTDEASPFALRSTRNRPRRAMRRDAADPTQSAFQPTAFVEPQEQPSPMSCASCQAAARKRIRA